MHNTTILHVDDDANDILLFRHACNRIGSGVNCQSVTDGKEALCYLEGRQRYGDRGAYPWPRLLLLDLKMPRLNGFDVLESLRQREQFKRLPILVLTSSTHEEDVQRAYELGANAYLVKPVSFDGLVEMVSAIRGFWVHYNVV